MIEVIHISDTHIGPTPDFEVRGANSLDRLEKLVWSINNLDFTPDLIVHTGDVTDDPDPDAYRIAADALSKLKAPVFYVAGNHDDAGMMREFLPMNGMESIAPDSTGLNYRVDLPGHRCFMLDANIDDPGDPHGLIPDGHLAILEKELAENSDPFSIWVHYPAFAIGSAWIDRMLLLVNGEELHRLLLSFGLERNRGVFFGHLHRGIQIYRDGILYSSVSSPACQFAAGLNDVDIFFDPDCPIPFNHITFFDDGTTAVKEHTLTGLSDMA